MAEESLAVLIVEDEPLGAARLTELLAGRDGVRLLGVAEDCRAAIEEIRKQRPDLVFLDIQIPLGSGIDVIREIGPAEMPATVFTTAYDAYATEAFRVAAVDYLLKPYSDERFEEAFERARRRIRLEGLDRRHEKLLQLIESEGEVTGATPYLDRIAVQARGRLRVIPVEEIQHIEASGVYAEIHTKSGTHLLREPLQTLEEQLDPTHFIRIHRSSIVRVDEVEMLMRKAGGRYEVQLRNGTRLPVGRSRRADLEERIGRL